MTKNELTFTPALTLSDAEYQAAAGRMAALNLDVDGDSGEARTLWRQWRMKHPERRNR